MFNLRTKKVQNIFYGLKMNLSLIQSKNWKFPKIFTILRFYLENHKFEEPNSSTTAPESWDVIGTSEIADSPEDDLSIKSLEIQESAPELAKDHDNFAVKDSNVLSQSDQPYSNQAEIQGDLVSKKPIEVPISTQSKNPTITPKEISLKIFTI